MRDRGQDKRYWAFTEDTTSTTFRDDPPKRPASYAPCLWPHCYEHSIGPAVSPLRLNLSTWCPILMRVLLIEAFPPSEDRVLMHFKYCRYRGRPIATPYLIPYHRIITIRTQSWKVCMQATSTHWIHF